MTAVSHPPTDQRLRKLLASLADSLEAEINAYYRPSPGFDIHPAEQRHFDRDMADVIAARTALAAPLDDGWVMVPRDPTETMVSAGKRPERHDSLGNPGTIYLGLEVKRIWHAMIAAAPTSPILSIGEGM